MADSGVWLAGLSTSGQPAARAGATLWATRLRGKLNGVMPPTTPTGKRRVKASLPSPTSAASMGTMSPARRLASTAEKVKVDTARWASMRAVFRGLAASAAMVRAKASVRSSRARAARSRISARFHAGRGAEASAWPPACTARSTSSARCEGASPTTVWS